MSVESASMRDGAELENENARLKGEVKRLEGLVSRQREKIIEARLSPTPTEEESDVDKVEKEDNMSGDGTFWHGDSDQHPHGKPKNEMNVRYCFADYLMHELVKRRVSTPPLLSLTGGEVMCGTYLLS